MNIILSPNKFIKKDELDRIFIYLSGNINQDLIDYLSENIRNYQIEFIDKLVLFYQQKIKNLSAEQKTEQMNWKKEYIYQSDIIISFFIESEGIDDDTDLSKYIQYFYETYKENLPSHFLIGYGEPYKQISLLEDEVKKISNNLLSPIAINDIKVLGDLILKKIEKLYKETDYSLKLKEKVRTLWPDPGAQFKIGILGKYNVGNKSIWNWFIKGRYIRYFRGYGPGTDTEIYKIEIKNKKYIVSFQFPAGQQKYDSYYLFNRFILNKNCFIFVFDITDKSSFDDVKNKYYSSAISLDIKIKHFWVLVGNKSDLRYKRNVSYEEANSFANEKNMKYFEVSVKSGDNMENLFNYVHSNLIEINK